MRELIDKLTAPTIGFVSSFITWEAFSSYSISLIVAFIGGFLAQYGKELARAKAEKRRQKNEESSIDKG